MRLKYRIDKPLRLYYNKHNKKNKKVDTMNAEDIKVVKTEDWRNTPPQYNNLTDNRTVEWGVAQELTDIEEEFAALAKLANNLNTRLVGGLQQGSIKEWEEIAQLLSQFKEEVEQRIEAISDKFY